MKVSIIGATGMIGSSAAFNIAVRGLADEIVLIGRRQDLAAHHASEIRLAPPTFVSVTWLAGHADTASAARALATDDPLTFRPRIHPVEDGACILYPGDAGYEAGDISLPGPRHRLVTRPEGWEYERSQAATRLPSGV